MQVSTVKITGYHRLGGRIIGTISAVIDAGETGYQIETDLQLGRYRHGWVLSELGREHLRALVLAIPAALQQAHLPQPPLPESESEREQLPPSGAWVPVPGGYVRGQLLAIGRQLWHTIGAELADAIDDSIDDRACDRLLADA